MNLYLKRREMVSKPLVALAIYIPTQVVIYLYGSLEGEFHLLPYQPYLFLP